MRLVQKAVSVLYTSTQASLAYLSGSQYFSTNIAVLALKHKGS